MSSIGNKLKIVLITGCILVSIIPVFLFWFFVGRVPYVMPIQARAILESQESPTLLIDTRNKTDYEKEHINGAINWPYEKIKMVKSREDIPEKLKNATLFFICYSGIDSAFATQKMIHDLSVPAKNIKGGFQGWGKGLDITDSQAQYTTLKNEFNDRPYIFPVKNTTWFEQVLACAAAFAIKPAYMILSFFLIIILFKKESINQKLLKWSMICFLTGESFCALNYILFGEDSYLVEYLHILGMIYAFGLLIFLMIAFSETKIMGIQDPNKKCPALSVCPSCYKYQDTSCGYIKILAIAAIGMMFCCFIPLCADIRYTSYNTPIFGTYYNYSHPAVFQYFEIRYLPVAAMFLFGLSFFIFLKSRFKPTQAGGAFFSAAAGLFSFSIFRLILFAVYDTNLWWFIIWEEITEMIFISAVAVILWLFMDQGNHT